MTDRVARFGGEEFVALVREVDETDVGSWAERIRQRVEATTIPWAGRELRVTISVGATIVTREDRDIEDVIHRADIAIYDAKSDGRNRVSYRQPLQSFG